ncbi:hypothetical protein pipiens_000677, partial [Culex pipiens pipiens]
RYPVTTGLLANDANDNIFAHQELRDGSQLVKFQNHFQAGTGPVS